MIDLGVKRAIEHRRPILFSKIIEAIKNRGR